MLLLPDTLHGVLQQAGLDSLGAVDLRNAVSAKFGIDLPATAAFDYPTASALAGHISVDMAPTQAGTSPSMKSLSFLQGLSGEPCVASDWHLMTHEQNIPVQEALPQCVTTHAPGSAWSLESTVAKLAALLSEVIGAIVSSEEPLMEVTPPSAFAVRQHQESIFILAKEGICSCFHAPLQR